MHWPIANAVKEGDCLSNICTTVIVPRQLCTIPSSTESRPQPLGKDELYLPPDLDCLSGAYSDNDPVLCQECARRGEGMQAHTCVYVRAFMVVTTYLMCT